MFSAASDQFRFTLHHPNTEWWRNDISYTFADQTGDEVLIRVSKVAPRQLVVHLIGALGRWITLAAELHDCTDGIAQVEITWNAEKVSLAINGRVAVESRPEAFVPTARDGVTAMVECLGREWVASQLDGTPTKQGHRFIDFYRRYVALNNEGRATSIEAPPYREMGEALFVAARCAGFPRILERLRDPKTFRDTMAECLAAAMLLRVGGSVVFQEESSETQVRTPDLLWTPNLDGRALQLPVEVKRVHSYNSIRSDAGKQWRTIVQKVTNAIEAAGLVLNVFVLFKAAPTEAAVATILLALREETALAYWRCLKSTDSVDVWAIEAEDGFCDEYVLNLPPCATLDTIFVSSGFWSSGISNLEFISPTVASPREGRIVVRSKVDGDVFMCPRFVALDMDEKRLRISNFITLFKKKAIRQLPSTGPGVVVMEIPPPTPEEVGEYVNWLDHEFGKGNFSRVNVVYVIWIDSTRESYLVGEKRFSSPAARVLIRPVLNPRCKASVNIADGGIPQFTGQIEEELIVTIPRSSVGDSP